MQVLNAAPGGGSSAVLMVTVENAPVTASAVTPSSLSAGAASAATLLVTGSGFNADTVARLDATTLTVKSQTATLLALSVDPADLTTPRTATLTVENAGPGGGTAQLPVAILNPVPQITNLSPAIAVAKSAATAVTVTGDGFRPTTTFAAGATALSATFVSATQMTVTLPPSALTSPGVLSVVATNGAPGGGTSGAASFVVNNPVPTLTSLSQSSVLVGSPGFTLTATGDGFVGSSTVMWGPTALTTTFISATSLSVVLPTSFLATPGQVAVSVVTPSPGGGATSTLAFQVNNPLPTLASLSQTSIAAGSGALSLGLSGTNFVTGTQAYWGSTALVTIFNSPVSVTALIPAVLLAIAFRSVFVGLVSLLPGLYPVVASGAILWALGGGLEFASVVALLVVFGLAIDALIHFFNRLSLEERNEPKADLAIRNARVLVGPAIILTTLVLAFGLGVTVFSDLPSLRIFGFVCGTTLMASLLADLVFLPALIMLVRKIWPAKAAARV